MNEEILLKQHLPQQPCLRLLQAAELANQPVMLKPLNLVPKLMKKVLIKANATLITVTLNKTTATITYRTKWKEN